MDFRNFLWLWIALAAVAAALIWGTFGIWSRHQNENLASTPFFSVSNRQISLFLWAFPQYAPGAGSPSYLPGFQADVPIINSGKTEELAIAPADLLFWYHAWARLLGDKPFPQRPIVVAELREFLEACPEWSPMAWPKAPQTYHALVAQLAKQEGQLPLASIPEEVQRAFIGWKNFFTEKQLIELFRITYKDLSAFLVKYPYYARHYWRNLELDSYPHYLETFTKGPVDLQAQVAEEELTPWLRRVLFNEHQAQLNL